jgi:hypothetical protein
VSHARYLKGTTGPKPRPLAERFWAKVDRRGEDECWEWTGSRNEHGYGGIRLAGQRGPLLKAHRVSFMLAHPGVELTRADHICHTCDNPPCVNPAHLYRGDYTTNTADKVARGRHLTGSDLAAVVTPHMPRGDAHWTRRMPERMNLKGLRRE